MTDPIEELLESTPLTDEGTTKLNELLGLLKKRKDDCADPDADCPDTVSPCCSAPMSTVRGSLPLMVVCSACEKRHLLRDIVLASIKK